MDLQNLNCRENESNKCNYEYSAANFNGLEDQRIVKQMHTMIQKSIREKQEQISGHSEFADTLNRPMKSAIH